MRVGASVGGTLRCTGQWLLEGRWLLFWWTLPFVVGGSLALTSSSGRFVDDRALTIRVMILTVTIVTSYLASAIVISRKIEIHATQLPLSMLFFIGTALLVILDFAVPGYLLNDLVVPAGLSPESTRTVRTLLGLDEALYFSAMTFTSVGYGDLLPRATAGRCLAMTEALIGAGHGVLFVLIFLRNGVTVSASPRPESAGSSEDSSSAQ